MIWLRFPWDPETRLESTGAQVMHQMRMDSDKIIMPNESKIVCLDRFCIEVHEPLQHRLEGDLLPRVS